ncbi:uncharacterized protein PFL1_02192 [Pseudozyma flocculosa PF-1]|uniref:Related to LYS2 \|nr:uncharacterized protein PFL1_02192 [Pseudozyma flocculosa PF-1]EPQ30075.1 hypothetical protein PFL1_02192 [Pseudozyma flocculosa PF-1]SPO41419.1 related to LYS2 \
MLGIAPKAAGPSAAQEQPNLNATAASSGASTRPSAAVSASTTTTTTPALSLPSLNALFAHRLRTQPDTPVVCIPAPSQQPGADLVYDEYSYRQLDRLVCRLAAQYSPRLPPRRLGQPTQCVAFIASSSFDFIINEMALSRLGYSVFFLSVNNSVAAQVHLVKATNVGRILYSPDQRASAEQVAQQLPGVEIEAWIGLGDLSPGTDDAHDEQQHRIASHWSHADESSETAFIVHSSGSTGFPKPIYITHKASVANVSNSFRKDAFGAAPLFHNYSHASLWRAIYAGTRFYVLNAAVLQADLLVRAMRGASVKQFYAVPYLLKMLAEHPDGLDVLRKLDLVTFAGSACPSEIGNHLVANGVKLVALYGATEVGQLMTSFRDFDSDPDWDFVRLNPAFRPYAAFEGVGADGGAPYELIVKPGWHAMTKTNRPDGSYATSDLFEPHPSIPDAYRFVGRSDDTLVHYNGEKTNPVPIELAIRSSPLVADCLVFGAGRAQAGVLIIPSPAAHREGQTELELRDSMLDAVAVANAEAPSHSRIVPEMIKVLPFGSKFTSADKGSLIRAKATQAFAAEIDQVYQDYDTGRVLGVDDSDKVALESEQQALEIVAEVVGIDGAAPGDDLIALGLDSLGATRVRNTLQARLQLPAQLGTNVVFENPTIAKLAHHVFALATNQQIDGGADVQAAQLQAMDTLYDECRGMINGPASGSAVAATAATKGEPVTVVLTGSTGSLGAHIVNQLAQLSSVARIVCLNRASSDEDAVRRTEASLKVRALPDLAEIQSQSSGVKVEAYASDLSRADLGLAPSLLSTLQSTPGLVVIHNGWPVNFNMSVESFRPALVSAVHLINLSLQSGGRFLFSSSVSAATRRRGSQVVETISEDVRDAQEMGYARSKWIVERLCGHVNRLGGAALVLRIGQMIGDSERGVWNETEAISLMIKSGQTVGCLPALSESVSWLPVDHAGWIIANLAAASRADRGQGVVAEDEQPEVVHVLNPSLTPFTQILEYLGPLASSVVPVDEWLDRLAQSNPDVTVNPTYKLLGFFTEKYRPSAESLRQFESEEGRGRRDAKVWQTSRLQSLFKGFGMEAELAQRSAPVSKQTVDRILAVWRSTGFLQ